MFAWTKRSRRSFHAENLKGRQQPYVAPGRGWYHIYTFRLGRPEETSLDWLPDYPEETLALVRLDIRDYASRELDALALDFAEQIFCIFRERKKEIILRVCYDTEGKGMEREPQRISMVQRHMQALGGLAERYADAILTVQGVFVGSWGEMHTSRFLRPDQICLLAQTWQEATHHAMTLSVRKPVHLRLLAGNEPVRGLGLYDDAMFAGDDHMGTFGDVPRETADWEEPWRAADEQAYLSGQDENILCGGEALAGPELSAGEVLAELQKMQVTYLNSIYDPTRMAEWKTCRLSSGKSLYEEIGSRLGYRICVLDAVWKKGSLWVTLKNEGFSAICQKTELFLIRETGDGKERKMQKIPFEICGLKGGQTDVAKVEIAAGEDGGEEKEEKLYLSMVRQKDKKPLPFANEGADGRLLIGRWMVQGGLHGREKGNAD